MADLITFIWFSMLPTLTYSQIPTQEDSPIKNITLDMKTRWLRWTNVENVNNITCVVKVLSEFKYSIEAKNNSACYLMDSFPWCQGVDFEIQGFAGKRFSKTFQILQRGEEGTIEENVSCQVHDANLMDCKWTVRETPKDIQYQFFYSKYVNGFADRECPQYKTDSEGRRVGCHFNNISEFRGSKPYHFLVTGTSHGREVQCNDAYISLKHIEIFKPPKIDINCTKLRCSMQWPIPNRRELWDIYFEYQLQILKVADKTILGPKDHGITRERKFDLGITDGKYTVKIRTRNVFNNENWSEWSEPQEFGHDVGTIISLPVLMMSLFGIVFIVLLIMGYLCKRYYVIQKILPPVPRIKDQISDSFHKYIQVVWEENKILPEQCKIEEIQFIEKTPNCP